VQTNNKIGLTFSNILRTTLRQDPDIIMVGEMRDQETAEIGLRGALTGHLVFSTIHTNDAPSTITRLQNMGTPDYLISAAVTVILAQRLARKNCSACKEIDPDVTPSVLKELHFSEEQISNAKTYRGKGCAKCKDTGYKGRMGIYEILNVTKPIKEAILKKATTPELKAIALTEGFRTMQDMGRTLILNGDLNFREFERLLSEE
jgi:type IV pilus assembly protein PilB